MSPSVAYSCLYTRYKGIELSLIVIIYVDDILLLRKDESILKRAKVDFNRIFDIKHTAPEKRFLGIRISETPEGVQMSQTAYLIKLLKRFNMLDEKENPILLTTVEHMNRLASQPESKEDEVGSFPYLELLGSALYLSVFTRPDIVFSVTSLALSVSKPSLID